MRAVFVFMCFGLFHSAYAQTAVCPLGPKDSVLTLQRVMINFGKFIAAADDVVNKATRQSVDSVTDDDLKAGIEGLAIAYACAAAASDAGNSSLMPAGANKLIGDERAKYLEAYYGAMQLFAKAIQDYAFTLTSQLTASPKDFSAAVMQKKRVGEIADEAHSTF